MAQPGDVTWNFQTLGMKFEWAGNLVTLQGMDDREDEGLLKIEDADKPSSNVLNQLINLCWIQPAKGEQKELLQLTQMEIGAGKGNVEMVALLKGFTDVFEGTPEQTM